MSLFDLPQPPRPLVVLARCRRCNRLLRDPVSLGYRIGPECRHQLGIAPPGKPPRIGVRWTGPVEGQQDLTKIDEGDEMATTPQHTGPDPRLLKLAGDALGAAMANDWKRAVQNVQALGDEFGDAAIVTAMLGWADTVISRTSGLVVGRPVALAFQTLETGHIDHNADDVPDGVRWAGRLLAARVADDQAAFEALIGSVPDDATWSKYVASMLEMSALNLRKLQQVQPASGEGEGR